MTLRPPTVLMRERKPCVRALFKLLGWNVLFIVVNLSSSLFRYANWQIAANMAEGEENKVMRI